MSLFTVYMAIREERAAAGVPAGFRTVGFQEFHRALRQRETTTSAGLTTRYDGPSNLTHWHVGGECAGLSEGPIGTQGRYYLQAP